MTSFIAGGAELRHGDAYQQFPTIADGSIDAAIFDPPYGTTDCKWDHRIDLPQLWAQLWRVLKPAGIAVVFAAQPFATDVIVSSRKQFRYELVWYKARKVGFLNANRQPLRQHELVLVFCRRPAHSTYRPQFGTGKPYKGSSRKPTSVYRVNHKHQAKAIDNSGTRHPTSVLQMNDFGGPRIHPTQKPLDLCRWLVRSYSEPGNLILDPFSGSASTGEACMVEGRRFIGFERDSEIYASATQRLAVAAQRAK